jgi:2-phospho-L-lactate transferase/gluconeogenesis factor (CofD/UPF0052 family)/molybdopterin-guanine dinucleotide biosynthesis protein A
MQITIFSGGSGSEELQKGLYTLFKDYVKVYVIINGYDDGKSTGIVRKIYNDNILGPSDLRKNHLIKHYLRYGKETAIYKFLNHRFTSDNPKEYCLEMLKNTDNVFFIECINSFFELENSKKYKYEDFSIGNIIYSYLLYNKGSEETCRIMSEILDIPNEVYFQSPDVLKLKAKTYNNNILETENDIVCFESCSDRIENIYLEDVYGNIKIPVLSSFIEDIILTSNVLLFSSGTQWSSLIPTYISINFLDIIKRSTAKKYLVMNIVNDKDMQGYTGEDYLNILNKYIPLYDMNLIYSNNSLIDIPINILNRDKYEYLIFNDIVDFSQYKHNGYNLTLQIFMNYYNSYMTSTLYVFDYDYTLYDPNKIELSNIILEEIYKLHYKKMILSANDYNNIKVDFSKINVISNHGSIFYQNKILNENSILNKDEIKYIINTLKNIKEINNDMIISERIVSIAIKPVLNRTNMILELKKFLNNDIFDIINTGRTTVEIKKKNVNKFEGLKYIINNYNTDSIQYISDEDDIKSNSENLYKFKKLILTQEECFMYLRVLNNRKLFLPDLLIIAGGLNTRMNNNRPKLLEKIEDKTCLEHIYNNSKNFISNMYILTNTIYYDFFNDVKNISNISNKKYKVIKCYGEESNDLPRGNLETLISGLKSLNNVKNDCLVMWSDCVPLDSRIFGELIDKKGSFIIPTQLEKDPYAYIEMEEEHNNHVKRVLFKKNDPTEIGYHDMSIFKIRLSVIRDIGIKLLKEHMKMNKDKEPHLFDLITCLYERENFATFYETDFPTLSFNSQIELDSINLYLKK